eukprot:CAMPEP_0115079864 /NCGR_PEP_ID=MMETSP0227-20121206/18349_1 /TAXON_ID=89957 /ORGANISM="Polarella glacialis, Strain CCMP 1383" /LENGTH=448 /DNA_ID=CAMNT_0002467423 /DNA_START=259 /DNA_END=1605 /DNA_ORIENTATION=+
MAALRFGAALLLACSVQKAAGQQPYPYQCWDSLRSWRVTWSEDKRDWCCRMRNVGCFSDASAPFDCQADFDSYQDSWSKTKQAWCCWKESRGCSDELSQQDEVASTTPKPQNYDNIIDCQAGIWDVEHLWDCEKQAFCCAEQGMGCPDNAFDCNSGYINWVHGWSKGKQIWCCARTGMGCPPTTMTATSTSTATVTETTPACQFTCLQQGVAVACGERVHYAAIHIFLGQPNACGSAHELVLNECKAACESCSVIEACYGAADIETSTLPPTLPPPTSTIAPPFDCHEGLEQWQFTWFPAKQSWCCEHEKFGCYITTSTATTTLAPTSTQTETSTATATTVTFTTSTSTVVTSTTFSTTLPPPVTTEPAEFDNASSEGAQHGSVDTISDFEENTEDVPPVAKPWAAYGVLSLGGLVAAALLVVRAGRQQPSARSAQAYEADQEQLLAA